MRIAVIGAGGVGGVFGAALAVHGGADVTFVARGKHLGAIRERGLRIEGGRGETVVSPAQATDDPASIGPVDLVLFCVKLWDVETAGAAIRPLVGPETAVIPLQNGIDAHPRLAPTLGERAVMGGVAQAAGFDAMLTGDIRRALWEKFILLAAMSGITAVTRQPVGPLRDDPDT